MGVQADQLEVSRPRAPPRSPARPARRRARSRTSSRAARSGRRSACRPRPRGDPDQHVLAAAGSAQIASRRAISPNESQITWPTPASTAQPQLGLGLVVAVHVDAGRVEARAQAPCGARRPRRRRPRGPRSASSAVDRGDRRRLARVEDLEVVGAGAEGVQVGPGARRGCRPRVDVGGRAELARDLDHVAAADLELAALVDAAAERVDGRARDRIGLGCRRAGAHRAADCDGCRPGEPAAPRSATIRSHGAPPAERPARRARPGSHAGARTCSGSPTRRRRGRRW